MNRYEFLVPNHATERVTVYANNEKEARQKLIDFDIDSEEREQDDYDFYGAELDVMEEEA